MSKDKTWKQVKADWRDVVLVCRKCSKKLDGGFGPDGDEALAKALKKALARPDRAALGKSKARRREIAVLDIGCLDICPKKAVVVLRAADPGRWVVVPEGADLAEVATRLGLGDRSPGPVPTSLVGMDPSAEAAIAGVRDGRRH